MVRRGAEITKCSSSTLTRISKTAVFTCSLCACVRVFVRERACMRACVCARTCVCVCARPCVRACVCLYVSVCTCLCNSAYNLYLLLWFYAVSVHTNHLSLVTRLTHMIW